MNCSGILRLALAPIVAFVTAGCGSRTDLDDGGGAATGTAAFPVGTYTNCAEGFFDLGSHGDLDSSGFEAGATLTLGQSGSDLTATYVQNGITQKLDFSVTTSTSATLAPTGQLVHGFTGMCVVAPGDFGLYPGVMSTSAGALAYDAGMVFITSQGIVQVDAGTCGTLSTPGTYWIICEDRQGETAPPIEAGAPSPAPLLATGEYACRSQVATYDYIDGTNEYLSSSLKEMPCKNRSRCWKASVLCSASPAASPATRRSTSPAS